MTIDANVAEQIIAIGKNAPQVYENGKRQGKLEGKAEGYTEGYIKGNTEGYDAGHSDGYTEGYGYGHLMGYEEGYRDGGTVGYNDGLADGRAHGMTEGIAQGKQAEREAWWGAFQEYGNRRNYWAAFAYWKDEYFNPQYPLYATSATYMFYHSALTRIPEITISEQIAQTFDGSTQLREIEKLTLVNITRINNAFNGCSDLETLIVEGVISVNGLDLHWSTNLSRASITSVMTALSTTTTGLTVTFSLAAVNKAFETSEGANDGSTSAAWLALVATRSNWTIALA